MEDDFALRCVRIFPGVNSQAELVTLALGLRPERRFAPLSRGLKVGISRHSVEFVFSLNTLNLYTPLTPLK